MSNQSKQIKQATSDMQCIQQGDVVLHRIHAIPEGAVKLEPGPRGYILAHGESGHFHCIEANPGVSAYQLTDGSMCVVMDEPQVLTHEEHNHIALPAGTMYKTGRVKEVDPFAREVRNVAD